MTDAHRRPEMLILTARRTRAVEPVHARSIRATLPALLLATICLIGSRQALAQSAEDVRRSAETSADDYIAKFETRVRIREESPLLKKDNTALEGLLSGGETNKSLFDATAEVDSGSRDKLMKLLQTNYADYAGKLAESQKPIKIELERVRAEWRKVRTSLNEATLQAAAPEPPEQSTGLMAMLLHESNRWIWLSGLWLIAVTTIGVVIDRRHAVRRLGWVRRVESFGLKVALGMIVGLPLIGTLVTFFFGEMLVGSLMPEAPTEVTVPDEISRPIAELEQDIVKDPSRFPKTLKTTNQKLRDSWLAKLDDADRALATTWLQSRTSIRDAATDVALQTAFLKQLKIDLGELETAASATEAKKVDPANVAATRRWTGVGLGLAFMVLTGGVTLTFRQRAKARQAEGERTCPRCLATGTLIPNVDETTGTSRGRLGLEELRCTNVIMEDPYQECDFVFAAEYRTRRKLGFPTLGVAESGKTHWLAMAYRELNQGRFPESVSFERIRSEAAEQFDRTVEQILDARIGTTATITNRLPDLLTFGFRDKDPLGCSHVLSSVSDYGGQVTTDVDSFYRRRALEADGYFFFLDPTKPSEKQALALTDFREDLRLIQGLQQGKQINRPVALCVSKLDLMVNMPYAEETNEIIDFYTELGDVDASFGQLSMKLLEKRSQLMENIRDTIWPGWNIEQQIHDLFGGRYLFFPLTPVGMNEPGETDLNQRVIEPYGILEPLLWLLHMNGYPVLE